MKNIKEYTRQFLKILWGLINWKMGRKIQGKWSFDGLESTEKPKLK